MIPEFAKFMNDFQRLAAPAVSELATKQGRSSGLLHLLTPVCSDMGFFKLALCDITKVQKAETISLSRRQNSAF